MSKILRNTHTIVRYWLREQGFNTKVISYEEVINIIDGYKKSDFHHTIKRFQHARSPSTDYYLSPTIPDKIYERSQALSLVLRGAPFYKDFVTWNDDNSMLLTLLIYHPMDGIQEYTFSDDSIVSPFQLTWGLKEGVCPLKHSKDVWSPHQCQFFHLFHSSSPYQTAKRTFNRLKPYASQKIIQDYLKENESKEE